MKEKARSRCPFLAYILGKPCLRSRTGLFEGLVGSYTKV